MKTKSLIIIFILLTLIGIISCNISKKEANFVLDGDLQQTYTSSNTPRFEGYVKNTGDGAGYDVKVEITCYSDSSQTTVIDTATGFPANQGTIYPDERAYFEAIASNCNSHNEIKAIEYKISWTNKNN